MLELKFCIIYRISNGNLSSQFQNRRTKWKKQENATQSDSAELKTNGSSKGSVQEFHSETSPPVATKTGKSIAAELNAKITAKQNSRLKQQSNGPKVGKHMEPPKVKAHAIANKSSTNYNALSHELPVQFLDKSHIMKSSYHNFHDVESRLSVTKIPVNDFKAKSAAPVALNLKRNYL